MEPKSWTSLITIGKGNCFPDLSSNTLQSQVKRSLASAHYTALAAKYNSLSPVPGAPFSTDGEAKGRRALRNVCLGYLNAVDGPERAKAQFDSAECMTDKLAAMSGLVNMGKEHPKVGRDKLEYDTKMIKVHNFDSS